MSKETPTINIARCYANVFRGNPWEEAFIDQDRNFISLEAGMKRWLQGELQLAYPLVPTASYIEAETSKPDTVRVLLTDPNKPNRVIAFGWGYSAQSPEQLVEDKWSKADQEDKNRLRQIITNACQTTGSIWYLSEVGVLPSFQGQKLGSHIVGELVKQSPPLPIIMRTNQDSPMVFIAQNNRFESIVGLETNYPDPLNPKRVLYVRRPQ